MRQAERDRGERPGLTTDERQRLTQLERENFELKRANEILRKASALFAQAELNPSAKASGDVCMLCGARGSAENGWRSDCSKNPPLRIRSKGTCAMAVAEAAQKAGITNSQGNRIDGEAVLRMYNRWQKDGAPREREQERLLRKPRR